VFLHPSHVRGTSPNGGVGEVGDGEDVASRRGSGHVSVLLRTAHDTHGAQVGFGHSAMLIEHNGGRGVGMKSVHQAGAITQQHEDFLAFGHPGMGIDIKLSIASHHQRS
jgi:hypothetical protein